MHFSFVQAHRSSFARWTCVAAIVSVGVLQGAAMTPAGANSKPSGPRGYTYAATEGQHFNISGVADVAYGDHGKFNRKTGLTGGIDCTNAVFGNPDRGVTKACFVLADIGPAGYTYAGTEGSHIKVDGLADVAYGSRGKFNRKTAVSGGVDCNNSNFGDPDKGVHKSCYILADVGPAGYTYAGPEGAHINITGVADVAYGDRGKFFRKTGVTVGIDCTNAVFGNPDPGVQKSCYTLADIGPTGFSYAGTEGAHLHFTGIVDVAYGVEGHFRLKTGVTSGISCDNSVFGDPDRGVHKSCYILADNGPAGFAYATTEGRHLHVNGIVDVAYGANGQFAFKSGVSGRINCSNDVFGDPNKGVHKSCYVKPH